MSGEDTLVTIREADARNPKEDKKSTTAKKRKKSPSAASVPPRKRAAAKHDKDDDTGDEEEPRDDDLLEAQNEEILRQRKIVKKLRKENARLTEEASDLAHERKRTARKSVLGSPCNDNEQETAELKAAKAKIEELKQELHAANELSQTVTAHVDEQASALTSAERKIEELKRALGAAKQRAEVAEEAAAANVDKQASDAERKIESLKQALEAAKTRAEVAEDETEIQQEIANELRRKMAELRRASKCQSTS